MTKRPCFCTCTDDYKKRGILTIPDFKSRIDGQLFLIQQSRTNI